MQAQQRSSRTRLRVLGALAFACALPFACHLAVAQFEPALLDAGAGDPRLWINALLVCGVVLVLWLLTGRALLSAWLGYWALWSLHALNAAKLAEMNRMLAPTDLLLLGQVAGNIGLFWTYLAADWTAMGGALLVLLLTAVLAWLEPRVLPRLRWRLPVAALAIVLLASVLAGHDTWRRQMDDARLGDFRIWSPDESMQRAGLVAGLVRLGWEGRGGPAPISSVQREALDAFLERQADAIAGLQALQPADPLPDLVLVQSEALFDPARLRGLEREPWMPAFRALQQRGLHGELTVPAYGGGTIRTEFEVLTALSLAAFPQVDYPYYGLTDRPLPALPALLGELGYRRFVVHPYERTFWNRHRALPNLGLDESHYDGDRVFRDPARRGPYVTDEEAFDATLALLQSDRPQFAFVITMENHSPWRHRDNIDESERDAIRVPDALDTEARKALQTYLLHLHHGDVALSQFAEAVLARERPTLLLVYGDHLPAMPRVYEQLGFDDGRPAWEQTVPYALVANFPIASGRRDLATDAIAPLLLQLAGLPMNRHLAVMATIRDAVAECTVEADCLPLLHHAARAAVHSPEP